MKLLSRAPSLTKTNTTRLTDAEIEYIYKSIMFRPDGTYALLNRQPYLVLARAIEKAIAEKNRCA